MRDIFCMRYKQLQQENELWIKRTGTDKKVFELLLSDLH